MLRFEGGYSFIGFLDRAPTHVNRGGLGVQNSTEGKADAGSGAGDEEDLEQRMSGVMLATRLSLER